VTDVSDKQPLAFALAEYQGRLQKTQAEMKRRGLSGLLLHHRGSIAYLTGFENGYMMAYFAAIVPATGEPTLLSSDFEIPNADLSSWCRDRVTFPVFGDSLGTTATSLAERGLHKGRLGAELRALNAEQYQRLRTLLPDAELVAADDLVANLKAIKSPAEVAYLRESARLSTLGIEAAFAEAGVGKTENDLAAAAASAMIRGGSEYFCIDPIVTASHRSGVPHTTFRRTPLRAGSTVLVEVGASICRYTAPLFRTIAVKPVSDDIRRAADACRVSLNVMLAAMKPGVPAADVARLARTAWLPICEQLIWHGIYAYSVGIGYPPDWNDAPHCVTELANFTLQPGMCFHATNSLRQRHVFGTALSETVLITETGSEVLTGTPRDLVVV
jgi:Xaa-Pro aminopeptidase